MLFNKNAPETPGKNPIFFDNLEQYKQYAKLMKRLETQYVKSIAKKLAKTVRNPERECVSALNSITKRIKINLWHIL